MNISDWICIVCGVLSFIAAIVTFFILYNNRKREGKEMSRKKRKK